MKWFRKLFFTRRDKIIAMAMQGFCGHIRHNNTPDMERAAAMSIQYADILIERMK